MARLEKRIRALEERDESAASHAALHALSPSEKEVLVPYAERWLAAPDDAPPPEPTPEEERVLAKANELRRRALREGWPPPPWPWGA